MSWLDDLLPALSYHFHFTPDQIRSMTLVDVFRYVRWLSKTSEDGDLHELAHAFHVKLPKGMR